MPVELVDSTADSNQAVASAAGIARVDFGPPRAGQYWEVGRITVDSTSVLESKVYAYVGTIDAQSIGDRTWSGNGDVADETQPILVPEAQRLIIYWTGCTPGAICSTRVQYDIYSRSDVIV